MKEIDLEKQYEKILNIKTTGRDDSNSDTYRYPYEPTPYCVLERLASSGYIGKKNTILDYGCGKGRVDFFLSYQTSCKSIGVEYDNRIYQSAEDNREKSPVGNRVRFENAEATSYIVPKEVDRVFFFNPFSVEILQSVIAKIIDSVYENPREVMLLFYFPSDEYIGYLMTHDNLEFIDEIECDDMFRENQMRERIIVFTITI